MKNYIRVSSLEEAYELRKKSKRNVILGGCLWMKMGNKDIAAGIDLSGLGLDRIEETEEQFTIGCMCSLRDLEIHPGLNSAFGNSFKEAMRHIVGVQFRNTATVGGSVFPRFGFSDVLTLFSVLDCDVTLYHTGVVSIAEFLNMEPDEDILVELTVRKDGRRVSYQSHRMTQTDFPVVTCAVARKDEEYTVAVGARPHKAKIVSGVKFQNRENEDGLEEFAQQVTQQMEFGSNMRGSGEYRSAMAKVLIKRAVRELK